MLYLGLCVVLNPIFAELAPLSSTRTTILDLLTRFHGPAGYGNSSNTGYKKNIKFSVYFELFCNLLRDAQRDDFSFSKYSLLQPTTIISDTYNITNAKLDDPVSKRGLSASGFNDVFLNWIHPNVCPYFKISEIRNWTFVQNKIIMCKIYF